MEQQLLYDILKSSKIVCLAITMKLSPEAINEDSGGGTVAVSCATADRYRRMVNEKISSDVRKSWVPPRFASMLMMNQAPHDIQE